MSFVTLPDPYPGRCLNRRNGERCLDYDDHDGRCRFPQPAPLDGGFSDNVSYSLEWSQPKPWTPPWEDKR